MYTTLWIRPRSTHNLTQCLILLSKTVLPFSFVSTTIELYCLVFSALSLYETFNYCYKLLGLVLIIFLFVFLFVTDVSLCRLLFFWLMVKELYSTIILQNIFVNFILYSPYRFCIYEVQIRLQMVGFLSVQNYCLARYLSTTNQLLYIFF